MVKHYSLCLLTMILMAATSFAQKGATSKKNTFSKSTDANGVVWKKQVYRVVDLLKKEEGGGNLTDVNEDKTLIEMISNDIKNGALAAFSNSDMRVLNKLTEKDIKKIFGPRQDTALVQDQASGRWETKISKKEFSYDEVHKYKILEEWSCHPTTGTTDIQILAIAPMQDIFSHDGVLRAVQPVCWIRFGDLTTILNTYSQYQPNNSIMSRTWDDYFTSDTKPSTQK